VERNVDNIKGGETIDKGIGVREKDSTEVRKEAIEIIKIALSKTGKGASQERRLISTPSSVSSM
jgi:hypothetical protein